MRTVELLEESLSMAQRLGYQIRHEWLGGGAGGACEFAGRKWLFVDIALNLDEQLDQVTEALRHDPALHMEQVSGDLQQLLDLRRAA